jgi:hypothetical protein
MQKDQRKLGTNGWNPMVAQAPAASETASKLELPCPPHPNPAITLTDRGLFAYQSTSAEARELMVLASFNQSDTQTGRPGSLGVSSVATHANPTKITAYLLSQQALEAVDLQRSCITTQDLECYTSVE